jgi:hypothetical protein
MIPVIMHSGMVDGLAFGQVPTRSQEARQGWDTRFGREISWF